MHQLFAILVFLYIDCVENPGFTGLDGAVAE
jgi:hypothetical protein